MPSLQNSILERTQEREYAVNLTAQNPCPCAPSQSGWSVIMGLKPANIGRKQLYRNFPDYILSDIDGNPTESEYVYKTVAIGLASPAGACVTSTHLHPLRLIVARTPVSVPIQGAYSTTYYLDTLSCGHQTCVYPQTGEVNQKRHRCVECGEAQLALKFPPSSVALPRKKGVA